jgi:hypothetical protein
MRKKPDRAFQDLHPGMGANTRQGVLADGIAMTGTIKKRVPY